MKETNSGPHIFAESNTRSFYWPEEKEGRRWILDMMSVRSSAINHVFQKQVFDSGMETPREIQTTQLIWQRKKNRIFSWGILSDGYYVRVPSEAPVENLWKKLNFFWLIQSA